MSLPKKVLKAYGSNLIVKREEAPTRTPGGIIRTTSTEEKPPFGKVIDVGPGDLVDGKLVPPEAKVDDTVVFTYGGTDIQIDGETFCIIADTDILAIVREIIPA